MPSRQKLQEMLDLTCKMWDDPKVHQYQNIEDPSMWERSIFLAGPTSREDVLNFKWRPYAVNYLRMAGYHDTIIVPEARNDDWSFKETFPTTIVKWEADRLLAANIAMFWVPRHQTQLPGRVTNIELGFMAGLVYANPKIWNRLVWGYPLDAWKVKSEDHWVKNVSGIQPFHDLNEMCIHVVDRLP